MRALVLGLTLMAQILSIAGSDLSGAVYNYRVGTVTGGFDWDGTSIPPQTGWGEAGIDWTVSPTGTAGGSISASYTFDVDRLGALGCVCPLLSALVEHSPLDWYGVSIVLWNAKGYNGGLSQSDVLLELDLPGGTYDQAFSAGTVTGLANGQAHTVRLCWWESSAEDELDGRVKATIDGTTIFDVSEVPVWVNGAGWLRVVVGHDGVAGVVANLTAHDDTSACETTAVIDASTPCCTTCGCATTPGTVPAGATGPILPTITPLWTPACTGGGTVLGAADLTDAESWAL